MDIRTALQRGSRLLEEAAVPSARLTAEVLLSVGEGQLVTLPASVANVWTSNDKVAEITDFERRALS